MMACNTVHMKTFLDTSESFPVCIINLGTPMMVLGKSLSGSRLADHPASVSGIPSGAVQIPDLVQS